MNTIQQWDKFETAMLIDTYILIEQDVYTYQDGYKILSQYLRNRAISHGKVIDDKFRNHNGMMLMLAEIKYLFTDGKKGKPGASKVFKEMYIMYVNSREEFNKILVTAYEECRKAEVDANLMKDAESKLNIVTNPEKAKFKNWLLSNQVSELDDNEIIKIIDTCNGIAQKTSIITKQDNIWKINYGIKLADIVSKLKRKYDYASPNYDNSGLYDKVIDIFVKYKKAINNGKYNPNNVSVKGNTHSGVVNQNPSNGNVKLGFNDCSVKLNSNSSAIKHNSNNENAKTSSDNSDVEVVNKINTDGTFREYFINFLNDKFPENYFVNLEKYIKIINFTSAELLNRRFDCLGDNDISNLNTVHKIMSKLDVVTNGNPARAKSVFKLILKIYNEWNKNNRQASGEKTQKYERACKNG